MVKNITKSSSLDIISKEWFIEKREKWHPMIQHPEPWSRLDHSNLI